MEIKKDNIKIQKPDNWSDEEWKQFILCIQRTLNVDEREIEINSSFIDDLGADSLDLINLIMEFSSAFDITISDYDANNIKTVQDAIKTITKYSK